MTSILANCLVSPVVSSIPIGTKGFMDRWLGQTLKPDYLHLIARMCNYLPVLAKGVSLAFLAEKGLSLIVEGNFFSWPALAFVTALGLACSNQTYWLTC